MASHNDQVFPVSLAEIAFTLILILMLLLGFMFLQEREARDTAEQRLQDAIAQQNGEATLPLVDAARQALQAELQRAGAKNPELLVEQITAAGARAGQISRLQQEVLDLTKRLVALDEFRSRLESAGHESDPALTREQVEKALVLQNEVERMLAEHRQGAERAEPATARQENATRIVSQALAATRELHKQSREKLQRPISPGQEPVAIREIVAAAGDAMQERTSGSSIGDMQAANEKLQTQLRFYEKRDKLRGLDHPPCWMDHESRIEYIFNVQTVAEGILVSRGWPAHREADARASEGFNALMGRTGTALTPEQFAAAAKPYLDYGRRQSPECRHFVYLSSTISNADKRDEARRLVNSVFYILERKAPVTP